MNYHTVRNGLLAVLAALTLTAVRASAAPAVPSVQMQLKAITSAENLWKDEFVVRWDKGQAPMPHLLNFDHSETYFAVTDLDRNGRLELLFRHAVLPKESQGICPYPLAHIPTDVSVSIYEISAKGHLERLGAENGYGDPDLIHLQPLSDIGSHGTRWHNVRTKRLSRDEYGRYHYTISYQRVALVKGHMRFDVLAEEHGSYNVYGDGRVIEIPASADILDGNPDHMNLSPAAFHQTALYQAFDDALMPLSSIRWMPGGRLRKDPSEALSASWQGFSYGATKGPKG